MCLCFSNYLVVFARLVNELWCYNIPLNQQYIYKLIPLCLRSGHSSVQAYRDNYILKDSYVDNLFNI